MALQSVTGHGLVLLNTDCCRGSARSASSADTVAMGAGRRESDSCSYRVELIAPEWICITSTLTHRSRCRDLKSYSMGTYNSAADMVRFTYQHFVTAETALQ